MSISIKERRALERAVDALGYAREQLGFRQGMDWDQDTKQEQERIAKARKAFRALLDKLSEPDVKR